MFEKLQRKWKVNGIDLVLILSTFALGGSICGIAGRKIMELTGIEKGVTWIITYIIILTIIWPLCVLLTSIPLGQFTFFKKYIYKIFNRFNRKDFDNKIQAATPIPEKTFRSALPEKKGDTTNHITTLAIFASGAGSNAKKIIGYFENNPTVKIALIVCNKPGAGVLQIAKAHHIETLIIERERFFNGDGYCPVLKQQQVSLIILAGFLWKIPSALLKEWPASIINIHPALLPKYGGKGMYGAKVHEAVIANKEKESGISIHYVDDIYDNGEIISQVRCQVTETDTPQMLAEKIHALEHQHYPAVIEEVIKAKNTLNKSMVHQ